MPRLTPVLFLVSAGWLVACTGSVHEPPDSGEDAWNDGDGGDASDAGDGADDGDGDGADHEPGMAPWVVFTRADATVPMSSNLLQNPDLETADGAGFPGWSSFEGGYLAGLGEGRAGNAIRLVRPAGDGASHGAYQSIRLDQPVARPLYFAGWSRAEGLTGDPDSAASIYLDIQYVTVAQDPQRGCDPALVGTCALYGQIPDPAFDTGTHGWQLREGFAVPAYPIASVSFYVLLRGDHEGSLWFDDLRLSEVDASVLTFDGRVVATRPPGGSTQGGQILPASTGDGLELALWSQGGAVAALTLDGVDHLEPAFAYASGFFVHDMARADWVAPGGSVSLEGGVLRQRAALPELGLEFSATVTPAPDRLSIHVELVGTDGRDRAVTLYFALPVSLADGAWGVDVRRQSPLEGVRELANTTSFWYDRLGATGEFSAYPFGTLFTADRGLVLGMPLDQARIFRVLYHPVTHQIALACDLGLSPDTTGFPNRAWMDLVLYRTRPPDRASGFRSALQGFYDRFPAHFARRIPAAQEGIWVAFADLAGVQNGAGESLEDFHIGIHELGGLSQVAFDEAHGIQALRYIVEPASTWLALTGTGVDPTSYDQVLAYLQGLFDGGSAGERALAEKTLSSGIFGADGRYVYEAFVDGPPWCPGACALFSLSPDPDLAEPGTPLNQAAYAWNAGALQAYTDYPGLDGEYLDSFAMWATRPDLRRSHFAAVDEPLTFLTAPPHRLGVPIIFSSMKFARWLKPQLPAGKYLIANAMLMGVPWGADLMDFMGQEIDWVRDLGGGQYGLVPEADETLSYRRALAYQRPYGFLMNTEFGHMSAEIVERYMRVCLFYGIYPSMFSSNASEGNYFETPALYQRDRALFKRYIPLIQALNASGWEPLTRTACSEPEVYVERFGGGPRPLYLTLRNPGPVARTCALTLDRAGLGLAGPLTVRSLLQGASDQPLAAGQASISVVLPAEDVELLEIVP